MSGKEIAHFTGEETLRLSSNCVYNIKYQEFLYLNGYLSSNCVYHSKYQEFLYLNGYLSSTCVYHSKYQEFLYLNGHLYNFRSMIVLNTNKIKNIKNI